jgi:hypothetical protein
MSVGNKYLDVAKDYTLNVLRGLYYLCGRIFHYSGLAFIAAKAHSSKNEGDHPTLIIWILSIYIVSFTITSQRYENNLDRLENKINMLVAQTGTDTRNSALSRIPKLQQEKIPHKPDIFDPM